MERKLATVLFVDLVESSRLVAGSDPEVVRRRVDRFFKRASECIEAHGGTVEKFAGDAVMAAFGIPRAHEDDALRAVRAALAVRQAVEDLDLRARIGIEAGEVVVDSSAPSTFATGDAVLVAARLQQAAGANEILVGPGAYRLAAAAAEFESAGDLELRGRAEPLPAWSLVGEREVVPVDGRGAAPIVGRESELELLENTYARAVRDRRAHMFTIFGEPGVGKSRLAREFVAGLEGATILAGRCLPYGEGITYWPLAEMVKAAAGIADDDAPEEAHEKLLVCCEDEEVADLIGLATGVLEAVEGERSQQEIAWAAREWAENLARPQPLVLVFEDIHWAEEPLLELIEHLAAWVREAPLLIVCLARPELLDTHPTWGGGRMRATAIELEPLPRSESERLARALTQESPLPGDLLDALLERAEGNPLFLEETVRMITEGDGDGRARIPNTLQALIAARIDRLPDAEKRLIQRAAVVGRIFWLGALSVLSPELDEVEPALDDLLRRDFVLPESRSSISGERAFRFKHVLIRDVAYAMLSKADRARLHRGFADWLRATAGEELVEIRAYHLDQAAKLLGELDGAAPAPLVSEAAAALEQAGRRAMSREANGAARKSFLRAVELEPTLERRSLAALAAWRLADYPALAVEAEAVLAQAREQGNRTIEGRTLNALADVALVRDADLERAQALLDLALDALPAEDAGGRFDALMLRAQTAWWQGNLAEDERFAHEALELARAAGRKDIETEAVHSIASTHLARLDLAAAEPYVERAVELAQESGSIAARAQALSSRGRLLAIRGEVEEAEELLEEARGLFEEAGAAWTQARTLNALAWLAWRRGDTARAERRFREAIRILKPLEDRATLCESQRGLAQLLVRQGKLEEAERLALESRRTVGAQDQSSRATTRMALGLVRAAQGRDDEAEELLREAIAIVRPTEFHYIRYETVSALARFLRERGRVDEAAELEEELASLGRVSWGEPAPEERRAPTVL